MSVPSATASQTDFSDTMSRVNLTSEPISGYDTPIPRMRISEKTLNTPLTRLAPHLRENHPGLATPDTDKRHCNGSPIRSEPQQCYIDTGDQYPSESKPIYLRLKGLHRKKLSLASHIKIMEEKLAKNNYPVSVDFINV